MTHRRATCVVSLSLACAVWFGNEAEAADLTGSFSGNTTVNYICHSGGTNNGISVPVSGTIGVSLSALQSGSSVNGSITLTNIPDSDEQCRVNGTLPPLVAPVSGTGSGGSYSLTAMIPREHGGVEALPIKGVLDASGNSLSLSGASGTSSGTSVTGSISRTSSAAPDSSLSGTWTGSVTETFLPCAKGSPVTYTGSIAMSLVQSGTALFGNGTLTGQQEGR